MSVHLVQAWNGKWHLYEKQLRMAPPVPVSTWTRVTKPERPVVLTSCGEQVYGKDETYVEDIARTRTGRPSGFLQERRGRLCEKCLPVLAQRLTEVTPCGNTQ